MKKQIFVMFFIIIAIFNLIDGSTAANKFPDDSQNAAIQFYRNGNNLWVRFNVIMAGSMANDPYIKNRIQFTYNGGKILGYEYFCEDTSTTYAELAKQSMEMLSCEVNGVYGEKFNLCIEVNVHDDFTNDEINEILKQTDDTNKNYIVVFPRISFKELKEDFPLVYNEYAEKEYVSAYTSYISEGSGYLVITTNGDSNISQAVTHEALHLLGVSDIRWDVGTKFANVFDIMRYGALRKNNVSNVHIYIILNAMENKAMYEWNGTDEELEEYVEANGLHYGMKK